jgi:hypothetical protein
METKDYFSLSFSGIALALSVFNVWRAKRGGQAVVKQKLEQMKFEAIISTINARSSVRVAREGVTAARFEAQMAGAVDAVTLADKQIEALNEILADSATFEALLQEMPIDTAKGTSAELQRMEGDLGVSRAQAARHIDLANSAAATAETIRRSARIRQV